jgi:hypothetical protein
MQALSHTYAHSAGKKKKKEEEEEERKKKTKPVYCFKHIM